MNVCTFNETVLQFACSPEIDGIALSNTASYVMSRADAVFVEIQAYPLTMFPTLSAQESRYERRVVHPGVHISISLFQVQSATTGKNVSHHHKAMPLEIVLEGSKKESGHR
jgi:hypothetical protein